MQELIVEKAKKIVSVLNELSDLEAEAASKIAQILLNCKKVEEARKGIESNFLEAFSSPSDGLPHDHWLVEQVPCRAPMLMQAGTDNPKRKEIENAVTLAVRYALRNCTLLGSSPLSYTPDALDEFVRDVVWGVCGYPTPDGTRPN